MNTWIEKKYSTNDVFDTFTPLHRLLKLFCLTSIARKKNSLEVSYSRLGRIIAIIVLVAITIIVSAFKIINSQMFNDPVTKRSIKFTDSLQVTYICEFGHILVAYFYVYKYGENETLQYLKLYEQIDKVLGMKYNGVIRMKIARIIVYTYLVCILISILDSIAWSMSYGWLVPCLYSVEYLFFFINTLVLVEMIANVIQVEYRLRTIGDILQDYYSASTTSTIEYGSVDKKWLNELNVKKSKLNPKYPMYLENMSWLNKCYLLLLEQHHFINKTFGLRVLINNAYMLLCMVNSINLAIRISNGNFVIPDHSFLPAITSLLRTLNCAMIIISLVHRCESSYKQTTRILSIIDHILVDKNINAPMRTTLSETRNLVVTRPIQFDAFKFYKLNYHLLDSFISVVVTLSVILLQNVQ